MQSFRTIQYWYSRLRLLNTMVRGKVQQFGVQPGAQPLFVRPRFSFYDFKRDEHGKTDPFQRVNLAAQALVWCLIGETLRLDYTTNRKPKRQLLSQVELLEPEKWWYFEIANKVHTRFEAAIQIDLNRPIIAAVENMDAAKPTDTLINEIILMDNHIKQFMEQIIFPIPDNDLREPRARSDSASIKGTYYPPVRDNLAMLQNLKDLDIRALGCDPDQFNKLLLQMHQAHEVCIERFHKTLAIWKEECESHILPNEKSVDKWTTLLQAYNTLFKTSVPFLDYIIASRRRSLDHAHSEQKRRLKELSYTYIE